MFRITPAPAGSTSQYWINLPLARDHPRACGEHSLATSPNIGLLGSPPRLRGALFYAKVAAIPVGITPAPAGSTCMSLTHFVGD